jgi:preprotein translocase subunit YajC
MPNYIPLLAMVVLFMLIIYFLMVRPLQQREKKHDMMVEELQVGDTVITAGGIYGTVDTIDADSVVLKIESGATMRVTKGGVIKRED